MKGISRAQGQIWDDCMEDGWSLQGGACELSIPGHNLYFHEKLMAAERRQPLNFRQQMNEYKGRDKTGQMNKDPSRVRIL